MRKLEREGNNCLLEREQLGHLEERSMRLVSEWSDEISSTMLIPLDLSRDHLEYRGEGNSSLVIALNNRQVLRLLKADAKQRTRSRQLNQILSKQIHFTKTTIAEVLPKELFSSPKLVRLTLEEVLHIQRLVEDKRPEFRLDKCISSDDRFALLLPDYCCVPKHLPLNGPQIGVEIKPKQGFLPSAEVLSSCTALKALVCRYGLSQFHKLNKGSIQRISEYCPLDLFSGCPSRQLIALRALIRDPQNNFRVFRDSKYAFGEESNSALNDVIADFCDSEEAFTRLLLSALSLKVCENKIQNPNNEKEICSLHNNQCEHHQEHSLADGCVLEAVVSAQRLDSIDSFLANEMLLDIENNNNEEELDIKSAFVKERTANESQKQFFERKVWQFLVSLTLKDCSIMIAMQRTDNNNKNNVIKVNNQRYEVSVRVTDLDEKSVEKIKRTLSNDKRMIKAYLKN